jgi:hypothetical protein
VVLQDDAEALEPSLRVTPDQHDLGLRIQLQELLDKRDRRDIGHTHIAFEQALEQFQLSGLFAIASELKRFDKVPAVCYM